MKPLKCIICILQLHIVVEEGNSFINANNSIATYFENLKINYLWACLRKKCSEIIKMLPYSKFKKKLIQFKSIKRFWQMIDVSCWFRQGNVCINFIRLHYSFHYLNFSLFFLREKTETFPSIIFGRFLARVYYILYSTFWCTVWKRVRKKYVSFLVCQLQLHLYRTDDTEKYLVICMLYYYNGK